VSHLSHKMTYILMHLTPTHTYTYLFLYLPIYLYICYVSVFQNIYIYNT
jgi:hypothetical protein